jgi:hypothetical protein
MKTKRCKVVVIPNRFNFVHLEIYDEQNKFIAATNECHAGYNSFGYKVASIPQSFLKEFHQKNGQIKEVLVELQECGALEQSNCIFGDICENCPKEWVERIKLDSNSCVIIHPVKTEMKIDDIPVSEIKAILEICVNKELYGHTKAYIEVKQWLEENDL